MPMTFEQAIMNGHFDKSVKIISGVNSEEGLILSTQFHKSSQRWNLFWQDWEKWAPMILFSREGDLITEDDKEKVNKIRMEFLNTSIGIPERNGMYFLICFNLHSLEIH